MLGRSISDPHQVEGNIASCEGLNYFPISTELQPSKMLTNVKGKLCLQQKSANVQGYEIHVGIS